MKKWLIPLSFLTAMNGCIDEDSCDRKADEAFERGKAAIQVKLDYCKNHIVCINKGWLECTCQEPI